ncbi:MAG TPA: GTPase Era [Terriglobales bacterium]|nr:GTPase Era [Terriglobales bacterium]
MADFRSGFVSIIGRPNAGKSTLLNALVGEKVAIVTHKPQTTRNRIQGIVNVKAAKGRPQGQMILVDTPGVHKPESQLSKRMMQEVYDALEGRDLILLIVDATQKFGTGDEFVLKLVREAGGRVFLLLNKIDLLPKDRLLPLIAKYSAEYKFEEIIPISASKQEGLEVLLTKTINALPSGPRYFPQDQYTDQPERFLASEIIREKVLIAAGQEVPYATAVVIEQFEESKKLVKISATIFCEREGQKAILIGKGGVMLKKIGTSARLSLEKLLGTKVFLELFIKVVPDWRRSRQFIDDLDWRRQIEGLGTRAAKE